MSGYDKARGLARAKEARGELYETLGLLKEQLNYAKRFDRAVDSAKLKIALQKKRNPVAFGIAVSGVAATAGLAVWGVSRAVIEKLSR